ncbi:hypothetical protein TNCV_4770761 [Trichonephila clavipes]|nr:hypothetical protein TNCV_4770761 [Trichonephila clavipes]
MFNMIRQVGNPNFACAVCVKLAIMCFVLEIVANRFCDNHRQEEEPMDWEDVPFFPEVSAPFVSSRPPRKIRSLISVQTEGGVSLHSRGCTQRSLKRAASRDQSSRPPNGVPRATLFFERYLRTIATMPTFKLTRQVGNPDFACLVATRTNPKHCACVSAKPESVGVYLSTRAVDSVGSISERSVEIWSR